MSQSEATERNDEGAIAPRYPRTMLATCCVPWEEDWSLAADLFRAEVRGLLAHGCRDLYIFGTAGEGYAISDRQFDQIVHIFREETATPAVRPMVGVISLSLSTIIERIERAASWGFRVFQISLPSWGVLTDRELALFFQEVCGRFPELHFLHYNLPRAGRVLTPDDYLTLAADHPNLVATKLGAGDLGTVLGLVTRVPQLQHFFTEFGFATGSALGPCSLLVSLSSCNLARARLFFEAGVSRDAGRLSGLLRELTGVHHALRAAVDGAAHMDGAYDKLFSRLHAPDFPLRLLPPYKGVDAAAFERFRAALAADYPQWLPTAPGVTAPR